jgi:hypothetical protein
MRNPTDVSGRTRNGDLGLPNSSRFANEKKTDGEPLVVDNGADFAIGQEVTFRLSGEGAPEGGRIAEVSPASEDYPNGGLFQIALDDGDTVEAWRDEITANDAATVDNSLRFADGQAILLREGGVGEPELGRIVEAVPADDYHPNGGFFRIKLDDGGSVAAWWDEITVNDSATVDESTRFAEGQTITYRLGGAGDAQRGTIGDVYPADEEYPNGGLFQVTFPSGQSVEAFWTEITDSDPGPKILRYTTGGGLLQKPVEFHIERGSELITARSVGLHAFEVTGEHGTAAFLSTGIFTDEIYDAAATAYDEFVVETLDAQISELTLAADAYRKRLGVTARLRPGVFCKKIVGGTWPSLCHLLPRSCRA